MAYKSDLAHKQHYIYRAYIGDQLAYIGVTTNPRGRFSQHACKSWWKNVTRIELEESESRMAAFEDEITYITDERPLYNVAHNSGEIRKEIIYVQR